MVIVMVATHKCPIKDGHNCKQSATNNSTSELAYSFNPIKWLQFIDKVNHGTSGRDSFGHNWDTVHLFFSRYVMSKEELGLFLGAAE